MKSCVLDASVIVKWIFPDRNNEDHVPQALHVLHAVKENVIQIIQPPHWLAEVASVVACLEPKIALETVNLLNAMEFSVEDSPDIYVRASKLSENFNHHLFDTLYHAIALYHGDVKLITADDHYYRKAQKQGNIIRLADFSIFND